jgi:DNA-directed RNA polymerase I subunit RPA49
MTKWHVDNLVTHICALALFVDDYEVDMFDLQRDLNSESKQLVEFLHSTTDIISCLHLST